MLRFACNCGKEATVALNYARCIGRFPVSPVEVAVTGVIVSLHAPISSLSLGPLSSCFILLTSTKNSRSVIQNDEQNTVPPISESTTTWSEA